MVDKDLSVLKRPNHAYVLLSRVRDFDQVSWVTSGVPTRRELLQIGKTDNHTLTWMYRHLKEGEEPPEVEVSSGGGSTYEDGCYPGL